MQGKIVKLISNDFSVLAENNIYICKSRGKFRNLNISPVVGDNVEFDEKNNYILDINERKNYLVRPPISNVDQAVIVMSAKNPAFSTNLLDKLLTMIEFHNIKPIICLTKLDLLNELELNEIKEIRNYYENIGYSIYDNDHIDEIKKIFKNKITVLTGQSGAGKSTLLNRLDKNLNLKTDDISYALGRGKHTTRHVELLPILDGYIADTPGFSNISFSEIEKEEIKNNFIEFKNYPCPFQDCLHYKEQECEVKKQVENGNILKSRYENYVNFIEKGDYIEGININTKYKR